MSFESDLGAMPVIDDDNYSDFIPKGDAGAGCGRGYVPRDYESNPFGSLPNTKKWTAPTFDRKELLERIRERTAKKARTRDIVDQAGLKPKNQQQTNYCWIFAVTRAVEVARVKAGQKHVSLSPASVGAKVKRFQNVGGWAGEAIEFGAKKGWVPTEFWPDTAIDQKYDTPENDTRRAQFRALEWFELDWGNLDQLHTAVESGFTVCYGSPWWSHEVCIEDLVVLPNGDIGSEIMNSWGQWGDNGRGVLTPQKSVGDYIAVRSVTAS